YRRVRRTVSNEPAQLIGRTLREDIPNGNGGKAVAKKGAAVDAKMATAIGAVADLKFVNVVPYVTDEVTFLPADEEERFSIAQANVHLNPDNTFADARISVRHGSQFLEEPPERVDFVDVSPKQTVSVAGALIPFLEHDDANRALMGCNMQRQAVPLIAPERPLVGTGMAGATARDSGQVILAQTDGIVHSVTGGEVVVRDPDGAL